MENPYQPPTHASDTSSPQFAWARVIAWSLLIFLAANTVGILSGLSMTRWEIYGDTIEKAVENARLIRLIAYGVAGALLYWRFASPLRNRLLHVMAAFVTVQLIDIAVSFLVFRIPAGELVDGWALVRSAAAAAVGLGLACLGSNDSLKKSPDGVTQSHR